MFIYVIEINCNGKKISKIGITSNCEARLKTISTSCPFVPKMVFTHKIKSLKLARRLESEAHRWLSKYRMNGEWFNLGRNECIHTLKEILKHPISGLKHARDEFLCGNCGEDKDLWITVIPYANKHYGCKVNVLNRQIKNSIKTKLSKVIKLRDQVNGGGAIGSYRNIYDSIDVRDLTLNTVISNLR